MNPHIKPDWHRLLAPAPPDPLQQEFNLLIAETYQNLAQRKSPSSPAKFWSHLEKGEVAHAFFYAPFDIAMHIALTETERLKRLGVFEPFFIQAYYQATLGHDLTAILTQCDRAKLLAAGTPLPSSGPFVVYRGVRTAPWPQNIVSGTRIEAGLSWTTNFNFACHYAARQLDEGAYGQSVFRAIVPAENVYFHCDPAGEQEYVCKVGNFENMNLPITEIRAGSDRHAQWCSMMKPRIGVGPIHIKKPADSQ